MSAQNPPPEQLSAESVAENVTCADCHSGFPQFDTYQIREPQKIKNGAASTHTYWICRKCWDRFVDAAAMSILRGL